MSISLAGSRGRRWGGVNVGRQFPAAFRKYFETNRIFSVALVYCDKMSTIASLGAKEEIKTLEGSLKTFSNIYKGNFHTNITEFQGEGFEDIAKPTAFDVYIYKRRKQLLFLGHCSKTKLGAQDSSSLANLS